MFHILINQKVFTTLLVFLFSKSSFTQLNSRESGNIVDITEIDSAPSFKRLHFGIEVIPSIVSKARIIKEQGNYMLKSNLQSSYDLGINLLYRVNKKTNIVAGIHLLIGKRNFYATIPNGDIPNYPRPELPPIIENKELFSIIRMPFLIEKHLGKKQANNFLLKGGFSLRYSGLMTDESIGTGIIYPNNQLVDIFSADLSGRNNGKPWVSFLAGVSKSILLDNKNIFSICAQADISTTYFLKSSYRITIPSQPISTGIYKINGSGLGLSVQYIFTGSNKQVVKLQKKQKTQGNVLNERYKREEIFKKFIFVGNHIQFNFSLLSSFKARLKNIAGDHPVSTSMAPGLLLSFKYQVNFSNKYSLISGPEVTLVGRNFHSSFSKNDFSPPLVSDYATKGYLANMILSLPVIMEKRWFHANGKFLFADAGFRLNFSLGADLESWSISLLNTNNQVYNAGGVDVYANNDAKPWISFPINAGHAWLLRNNNLLQLAICSNISFTKYVNGTYYINIPNQPVTEGKYSSTGSFIGLSLNYVFTNANYRIRKAYEKKK